MNAITVGRPPTASGPAGAASPTAGTGSVGGDERGGRNVRRSTRAGGYPPARSRLSCDGTRGGVDRTATVDSLVRRRRRAGAAWSLRASDRSCAAFVAQPLLSGPPSGGTMTGYTVDDFELGDSVQLITLAGDVDRYAAPALQERIERALAA